LLVYNSFLRVEPHPDPAPSN